MTVYEKMKSGELYFCDDSELTKLQTARLEKLYDFNATGTSESKTRETLMRELLPKVGENFYIDPLIFEEN